MVEVNLNTRRTRYLADMRVKRFGTSCTIVGRMVVVAGGWRDKTSEILDLDTEKWSRAGDMTTVRFESQMVTVNGRAIILGGQNHTSNTVTIHNMGETLDTVEELDMEQRTWKKLRARMQTPRQRFAAIVMERSNLCN